MPETVTLIHRIGRWVRNEENRNVLAFFGAGLVAIAIAAWTVFTYFDADASESEPSIRIDTVTSGRDTHIGSTIYNNGISFEQYSVKLEAKEKEIRALLVQKTLSESETRRLMAELKEVERRRADEKASYEAYIKDLEERIARLDELKGQAPDDLIQQAQAELAQGNTTQADTLFAQVESEAESHIAAAAEAAYQRGKLAEDDIHYSEAYRHYERAAQLKPDSGTYLNQAGLIAHALGKYDKAIAYYEQALASDVKTFGDAHPTVAARRNNLGVAWRAKGEYDKAIGYYEQALASDLKTFGEAHPDVATDRNNLGGAWRAKGEYDKAIAYYEQALASDLKIFGDAHPRVATERNNLGETW
ncbi:MAG: tetratricopeptide repeat protein, partial [Gammaproteobacteria bacterium]